MIEDYLIEDDFNLFGLNDDFKEEMVEIYYTKLAEPNYKGYSVEYKNPEYVKDVSSLFLEKIHKHFDVSEQTKGIKTWLYIQDNKRSINGWHNHVTSSTINATFYIDPAIDGGELRLRMWDQEHIIQPKENKIYMFPYWLDHKPFPQKDTHNRICVNLEYNCRVRPIRKDNQMMW